MINYRHIILFYIKIFCKINEVLYKKLFYELVHTFTFISHMITFRLGKIDQALEAASSARNTIIAVKALSFEL